ncbi:hypothetical protein PMW_216 [Pseudomonas phage phiPMW]|uniref:Uncharacterized protein n=1 Tax=Pseudomonas phage phiPMW TaxID=1815582 RepID=A0A1S5R1Q8_9CAUD|nr:hypothetical protein FDG97_gp134 [Pseudomonas phage phiPMW]ANA49341.1 hypothetical protein PMW_216 [Pseudomonas phage phiPMW]
MSYAPHEQRVIDELNDLSTKLSALTSFIDSKSFEETVTDPLARSLLLNQEYIMEKYVSVLKERIKQFSKGETK